MGNHVIKLKTRSSAQRGAALLDIHFAEWYKQLNLEGFTIKSGCNCVLGQLYGSVERGWNILNSKLSHDPRFDRRQALIDYGFAASTIGGYEKNLQQLDNEWLIEINRRLPGILSERAFFFS